MLRPASTPQLIEDALILYKVYWWERYSNCGTQYALIECDSCGNRIAVPISCGIRLCYSCSQKRGRRIQKKYLQPLQISRKNEHLSFLTLTIRNVWNLEIGFQKLKKAIKHFLRRKYVSKRIKGGLYAYEVKVDENGWYNLHTHFLLRHNWFGSPRRKEIRCSIPPRLKQTKGISSKEDLVRRKGRDNGQITLSTIWEDITSDPVLDIRKVRSVKGALRYLVKYILKPPSFPCKENYVDYLRCFEHKPLVVSFGDLRGGIKMREGGLVCNKCGSMVFFFVCIVNWYEVEDWLSGHDPPPLSSPMMRW